MTMTFTDDTLSLPLIGPGPEYVSRHIWLPQLVIEAAQRGETVIEGKTFTDCRFEGPAVLLPVYGCRFDGCNMGDTMGDARNLMLNPMGPQKVTGVIAFKDCAFVNSYFLRVGFTGQTAFLNELVTMLDGEASR